MPILGYFSLLPMLASSAGVGTIVVIAAGLYSYYKAQSEVKTKEIQTDEYYSKAFQEVVLRALKKVFPESSITRGPAVSEQEGIEVRDFILGVNDKTIPIEVQHRWVNTGSIYHLARLKDQLHSEIAFLFTSVAVTPSIRKTCEENEICLIENVRSEGEITSIVGNLMLI